MPPRPPTVLAPRRQRSIEPGLGILANYTAEMALLGAILVRNEIHAKVSPYLKAEHFADALHGRIYEACGQLVQRGQRADVVTLAATFNQDQALKDIGGARYLAKVANSMVTLINAEDYGVAVLEMARRRRLVELADGLREDALDLDDVTRSADDIVAESTSMLAAVSESAPSGSMGAGELAVTVVENAQNRALSYSTGLKALDDAMGGGLFPGMVYGVRAPTKAGKSVLGVTISDNLNWEGVPHLYMAFEMTPVELARRSLARRLAINPLALMPGARTDILLAAAEVAIKTPNSARYAKMAGRTFDEAMRSLASHVVQYGIKGAILDYLQLVGGRRREESRADFQDRVAQGFADFCRRHDLWGLVFAQINREGETRGGDGMNFACDQLYRLYRTDPQTEAVLRMDLTRYTPYHSVGEVNDKDEIIRPGLLFHKEGPWFADATA